MTAMLITMATLLSGPVDISGVVKGSRAYFFEYNAAGGIIRADNSDGVNVGYQYYFLGRLVRLT